MIGGFQVRGILKPVVRCVQCHSRIARLILADVLQLICDCGHVRAPSLSHCDITPLCERHDGPRWAATPLSSTQPLQPCSSSTGSGTSSRSSVCTTFSTTTTSADLDHRSATQECEDSVPRSRQCWQDSEHVHAKSLVSCLIFGLPRLSCTC